MTIVFILGRIILGGYWLKMAYNHLVKGAGLIGYAQMKGVKSPKLAVYGSGVLALIGGLSILTGFQPTYGIAVLVIFLIGVTFKMHPYWKIEDPMQRMGENVAFYKNMAILGALLTILAVAQPWVWSI